MGNILITGGAGFIGSNVADFLLESGKKVVCIDNFSDYYCKSIKMLNIRYALGNPLYNFVECDIENIDELRNVFKSFKIDSIVHLAARAGVRPSIDHPVEYVKTNLIGTVNILELMREFSVTKMSMASSSSVYGNSKSDVFSETLNLSKPISPYAATKLADELLCYTYHHLFNLNICMLRFFTVYGPRQRPDLAINKFIDRIEKGKEIDMYGTGNTMRDYTFISDIVDGIVSSLHTDFKNGFEIINLGGGEPIKLIDMISIIEETLGKKAKINVMPMQLGDVEKTVADISKAQILLNYSPKVNFREGIKQYVNWRKNNAEYFN